MNRIDCAARRMMCGLAIGFLCLALATPAAADAKTYIIFFDRNSTAMGASAVTVLKETAQGNAHARFAVVGHCDTSEPNPDRLSLDRAKAVRAMLLKLSVPSANVKVGGVGASDPLVPTGPNVSQPQNRRVIITVAN